MTTLMAIASVCLQITPKEQLQQLVPYVNSISIIVFGGVFFVRHRMLTHKFSQYIEHCPKKSHRYKIRYISKAMYSSVFFATELFSIWVLVMYVFIVGFGMGDDDFRKIQAWETMSSFVIFPFLGQIMPILLKRDERHHKESREKAGLYHELYY